jgi:hypothetical protein
MQKAELHGIRRGKNYSYPIGCLLSRKILSLQRLSANLGVLKFIPSSPI